MAKKLNNFEKFERKKIKFEPCSQPKDLLMTGQMPQTTQPQVWLLINTQNLGKKKIVTQSGVVLYKNPSVLSTTQG